MEQETQQSSYRDDLIRAAMAQQRVTAKQLQTKTGVGYNTIIAARNGRSILTTSLEKIADGLGLPMRDLYERKIA